MKDQETINRLALFTGWEESKGYWIDTFNDGTPMELVSKWNPYQDENHGRQVIEKVMEDEELWRKVISKITHNHPLESTHWQTQILMKATLPERMDAVIQVLDRPS